MSIDVGVVVAAMRRLLDEVGVAATTMSNTLPERQYVTTGGAVYDCAQVSVSATSIATGIAGSPDAGQAVANCGPGWNVLLEIAIVRDANESMVTRGRRTTVAPKVEDIEIDTVQADMDAASLTKAVETIAGPDWDQYGSVPASIQFGDVEGGLTAVVLTVTLNLWSFPPETP